jgi:uncharacterized membrane protein
LPEAHHNGEKGARSAQSAMRPPASSPVGRLSEKNRVEAFSDGVFAIALTLLVLDLHVPHLTPPYACKDLIRAIAAQWPSLFAMVFSFFVVLSMWYTHHDLMRWVHSVNKRFLFANGLVLLVVSFAPFPAAVLAQYINTPAAGGAAAFYCGVYILNAIAFNIFLRALLTCEQVHGHVPEERIRTVLMAYNCGPFCYLATLAVCFYHPWLGLSGTLAMWILWLALDYRSREEHPRI